MPERIPAFEPETRRSLERAFRAAVVLGHDELNTAHLLLGLLDTGHAALLPDELPADEGRQRVLDLLDSDAGRGAPGRTADPGWRPASGPPSRRPRRSSTRSPTCSASASTAWSRWSGPGEGENFLDALAREPVVAGCLGRSGSVSQPRRRRTTTS